MVIYTQEATENITHKQTTQQYGGKFMDIKSYADILRFAIKMQIDYKEKEFDEASSYEEEKYLDGVIMGLRIALEKIDASMFLAEK